MCSRESKPESWGNIFSEGGAAKRNWLVVFYYYWPKNPKKSKISSKSLFFFQSQTQAAEERREIWQNQTFAMQASRLRTILTSAPLLQQCVQDKWGCMIFFSIVRTPLFLSKLWWKYVNLTKPNCPFYPSNVRPALLSLDQWEIETYICFKGNFQYSSLVMKPLDQYEIATHWRDF